MKLSQATEILEGEQQGDDVEFDSVSTDTRQLVAGDLFIALRGPNFDGNQFVAQAAKSGAVAAVVSADIVADIPLIRVNDTTEALGQLAAYHREQFDIPTIAVTGSCGKTTTRAMLASIFSQVGNTLTSERSFNNNIGVPLTLLRLQPEHDYAVLEMGANHPGEIAYLTQLAKPTVAIITNAGFAHLAGFGDVQGVACAKGEIFQGLSQGGAAIINNDDRFAGFWCNLMPRRSVITFGMDRPADVMAHQIELDAAGCASFHLMLPEQQCDIQLPLMGKHNVSNALSAAAAASALGIDINAIKIGLETVLPVNGRLVEHKGWRGATIIDDSYNANPTSVTAAIDVLAKHDGTPILVFGDMLELGEGADALHQRIGEHALQSGIARLYCYGRHSRHAAEAFGDHAYYFDDQNALISELKNDLSQNSDQNATVLVKGSFSMNMRKVAEALLEES